MNVTLRTVFSISLILGMLCVFDFVTRVHIQSDVKNYQQNDHSIPKLLKSSGAPDDLVALLARYQSGKGGTVAGQGAAAGESGSLADYRFSLLAIYQKSGQYTAVLSVEGVKGQPAELIKMNKATVYSEIVVKQLEQKFIVLAHQQQTIRLRLFEKSGSKS